MSKTLYCRVDGDRVIEYPVTVEIIERRKHPLAWYLPTLLVENTVNNRADIQDVTYDIQVGVVVITKTMRPFTLEELLATFALPSGAAKPITDISTVDIEFAASLAGEYLENQLQTLVKSKGYNSIDTAIGRYSNSNNSKFRKEAEFVQQCLDHLWEDSINYFQKVKNGVFPVPTKIQDIQSNVRQPKWPQE